jgi:hypothetical protein
MTDENARNDSSNDSVDHTDEQTLRRLYEERRYSINDIADMADVDYATVHYWMQKHGVARRDKSDELRRLNRKERAHYFTTEEGRTYWRSYNPDGSDDYVLVYRLLAVAEYGFDAVAGNVVHHRKPIPWLNTPDNIEVMSEEAHGRLHGKES